MEKRWGALLCLLATLTACAGSHGSAGFVPSGATPDRSGVGARRAATLTLRIRIPKRTQRIRRHSRYISVSTKGMTVAFAGAASVSKTYALTPASPNCSGSPLTCTFSIPLTPGSYTATIDTYDQAPVGGAIPGGAGLLSTATSVPVTIVSGANNQASFVLEGVPGSIVFSAVPNGYAGSGFLAVGMVILVKDADGNDIVGTYSTPVKLTDSDPSGQTDILTAGPDNPPAQTLLSSSDGAQLNYTGTAIPAALLTATAGPVSNSALFKIHEPVFVADAGHDMIKEIPYGCTGNTCVQEVAGGPTGLTNLTFDGYGYLYYADSASQEIVRMTPCFTGWCTAAIVASGFSNLKGLAVDPKGLETFEAAGSSIWLTRGTCSKASCAAEIAHGTFSNPTSIAIDGAGNLYVSDPTLGKVFKVPASCVASPGSPCTAIALGGTTFTNPQGVALDVSGNVYVADTFGSVYEMANTCTTGSCVNTIGSGFISPASVAVDGYGDAYVLDTFNNSVQIVKANCTSSCQVSLGGGFTGATAVAVP
jgi:hypothetical protein